MPVAVEPSGRFAYAGDVNSNNIRDVCHQCCYRYAANGNSNNIAFYTIDGNSGALTSTGTVAAGKAPGSIVTTARLQ